MNARKAGKRGKAPRLFKQSGRSAPNLPKPPPLSLQTLTGWATVYTVRLVAHDWPPPLGNARSADLWPPNSLKAGHTHTLAFLEDNLLGRRGLLDTLQRIGLQARTTSLPSSRACGRQKVPQEGTARQLFEPLLAQKNRQGHDLACVLSFGAS